MSEADSIVRLDGGALPRLWPRVRAVVSALVADRRQLGTAALFASGDVAVVLVVLALGARAGVLGDLSPAPSAIIGSACLYIGLSLVFGLYETCRSSPIELFRQRFKACAVFCALLVLRPDAEGLAPIQAMRWLVLVPVCFFVATWMAVLVTVALKRIGLWQLGLVLVGDPAATGRLSLALRSAPGLGLRVIDQRTTEELELDGNAQGPRGDLAVLIASGDGQRDARAASRLNFRSVVIVREAGDMQTLWLKARMIGGSVGIEIRPAPMPRDLVLKRVIDVVLGCIGLAGATPVILVAAAAVWCFDRRNPFYVQPRPGLRGRIVRVWKVRSMFHDAEGRLQAHLAADAEARAEWARGCKLRRDPRILPGIGRFIRRASIDELPQFWNVVKGEMSMVGPRPFPAYHLDRFDQAFQSLRASVVPGLTGYWQITSRSDSDLETQQVADTFYVRNWSVWLDFYIIVHTPLAIVFGKGAR